MNSARPRAREHACMHACTEPGHCQPAGAHTGTRAHAYALRMIKLKISFGACAHARALVMYMCMCRVKVKFPARRLHAHTRGPRPIQT